MLTACIYGGVSRAVVGSMSSTTVKAVGRVIATPPMRVSARLSTLLCSHWDPPIVPSAARFRWCFEPLLRSCRVVASR